MSVFPFNTTSHHIASSSSISPKTPELDLKSWIPSQPIAPHNPITLQPILTTSKPTESLTTVASIDFSLLTFLLPHLPLCPYDIPPESTTLQVISMIIIVICFNNVL